MQTICLLTLAVIWQTRSQIGTAKAVKLKLSISQLSIINKYPSTGFFRRRWLKTNSIHFSIRPLNLLLNLRKPIKHQKVFFKTLCSKKPKSKKFISLTTLMLSFSQRREEESLAGITS